MNAKDVADKLLELGVTVLSFKEGDEHGDGEVSISENVHVQVGYFDGLMNVTRAQGEEFHFYPNRRAFGPLVLDIKKALVREQNIQNVGNFFAVDKQ